MTDWIFLPPFLFLFSLPLSVTPLSLSQWQQSGSLNWKWPKWLHMCQHSWCQSFSSQYAITHYASTTNLHILSMNIFYMYTSPCSFSSQSSSISWSFLSPTSWLHTGIQTLQCLHNHTGSNAEHCGRLLENGVGVWVLYHCHVNSVGGGRRGN